MILRRTASLLLIALFALCSCVGSNRDTEAIYSRLSNTEKQIKDINRQLNMTGEGVVPGQADMWAQIQAMRQDLNQVSGDLADWRQQNSEGENYAELRARVSRIESAVRKLGSVLAVELNELEPPDLSAVSPQMSYAVDSGGAGAFSPSAGTPGSDATPGTGAGIASGASGAALSTPPAALATAPASGAGEPVVAQPLERGADLASTLYNSGTKAFSDRNYQDAVKIFQDFVKVYPKNRLTGNAYFWLGESYYQLKNYNGAILAYQQIIENFSGSNKLQSALFKQGVCMYQKGQQEAGKVRLNELIAKYPKSPEADRARQFIRQNS
ncbi:MAG: tol-pal system protein YbgF [Deltaproteobacteria bacterium]|jgi:tol-pal system protein YbgF|nr:tol-pal system protein YbgF [Deltaproteobacteria bacterium]